jgi:hypothetical protein
MFAACHTYAQIELHQHRMCYFSHRSLYCHANWYISSTHNDQTPKFLELIYQTLQSSDIKVHTALIRLRVTTRPPIPLQRTLPTHVARRAKATRNSNIEVDYRLLSAHLDLKLQTDPAADLPSSPPPLTLSGQTLQDLTGAPIALFVFKSMTETFCSLSANPRHHHRRLAEDLQPSPAYAPPPNPQKTAPPLPLCTPSTSQYYPPTDIPGTSRRRTYIPHLPLRPQTRLGPQGRRC